MSEHLIVDTKDLGQIKIPFHRAEVHLRHDDNREEHHTVRVFLPAEVSGQEFADFMINLVDEWAAQGGAEGDPHYCDLRRLLWFNAVFPNKDRKKIRRFDARTFERCETLRSLTELTNTRHATTPERIRACTNGDVASRHGLESLFYNVPEIRLPIGEEEYHAFRQLLLDEIGDAQESVREMIYGTLESTTRQRLRQTGLKRISRRRIEKSIADWENGDGWERAMPLMRKFFTRVAATIQKQEQATEERFQDLVNRIDRLRELLEEQVEQQGIRVRDEGIDDETVYTPEFVRLLELMILPEADDILDQMRLRIEQDHALPPVEVIELAEFSENGECMEEEFEQPELTNYQHYQASLAVARSDNDALFKWSVLCQMRSQIVSRTECMRLLQREAELAFAVANGLAAREVYIRIRKHLTLPERRLFKLLHFPNPLLGGRVAMLERVAWTFATEMDEETTGLLFAALILKSKNAETSAQLHLRWQSFLRFYPYWQETVRADERERWRLRSERKKGRRTPPDAVPDRREFPAEIAAKFAAFVSRPLPERAARHCTPTQAKYLLAYFEEGRSELEIAREYRVTQQAVSKAITTGVSRLIDALERDKPIEAIA